jgi:hypothetical protein
MRVTVRRKFISNAIRLYAHEATSGDATTVELTFLPATNTPPDAPLTSVPLFFSYK